LKKIPAIQVCHILDAVGLKSVTECFRWLLTTNPTVNVHFFVSQNVEKGVYF